MKDCKIFLQVKDLSNRDVVVSGSFHAQRFVRQHGGIGGDFNVS